MFYSMWSILKLQWLDEIFIVVIFTLFSLKVNSSFIQKEKKEKYKSDGVWIIAV